jgi:hypothetical protein
MTIVKRLSIATAITIGITLTMYPAARASVIERLARLGAQMTPYLDDRRTTERPREIAFNGARLYVAAGHTPHPPSLVRRWYRERYRPGLHELAQALGARGVPVEATLGQLEFGDDEAGGVATLDTGGTAGLAELRARFERFVDTHDLGELGQLRFVRWQRDATGGTRFFTVWSDARFSLDAVLPPPGRDAGGGDLAGIPRPPGALRVLAVEERGVPYRLRMYRGGGGVDGVRRFYAGELGARGWRSDEQLGHDGGGRGARFTRAGAALVVDIAEERGAVVTSLLLSGGE